MGRTFWSLKKNKQKKKTSAVASAMQSMKEKEAVISPLSPLLPIAPPLLPSLAPFINTFQASDWSVIDNHASHTRVSAFIPALLYIPSCLTWADSRRRSRHHAAPPARSPPPSTTSHPFPPPELGRCFEKRHQRPRPSLSPSLGGRTLRLCGILILRIQRLLP